MKLRDIIALGFIVVLAIGGRIMSGGDGSGERRPDPRQFAPPVARAPSPETPRGSGRVLPPESFADPRFIVEVGDKQGPSSGTAFSVNQSGVWITARHVTDGCDIVGLQKTNGRLVRVRRVKQEGNSDISVLWTGGGTPAMPIIQPQIRIGEDGYSFGFPKGNPGDVHARVLGRGRMLARGRYNTDEPVVAWTQVRRIPDIGTDLSGISGGPWVNARGEVIGVHVAGSPRRGRSYSTAPKSLLAAISSSGVRPEAHSGALPGSQALNPRQFSRYGDALRSQLTVAKVACLVGEKWKRMARDGQG
jgi:S1-C subfamily serine protease